MSNDENKKKSRKVTTKIVDGVEYITATEAARIVGGSRDRFYKSVKPYLRPKRFPSREAPWYNKEEVIAIASGKPLRRASIPIRGMFTDWTKEARKLGYDAHTINRDVVICTLPEDLATSFNLSTDQLFVKRGRLTMVDTEPICSWDTYYPVHYLNDIIEQIQHDESRDIVNYIKQKHGIVIKKALDRVSTRITTLDEQNMFQLINDEPLLILQRAAWTQDKQALVLFSAMALLARWFVYEHEADVNNWDDNNSLQSKTA